MSDLDDSFCKAARAGNPVVTRSGKVFTGCGMHSA